MGPVLKSPDRSKPFLSILSKLAAILFILFPVATPAQVPQLDGCQVFPADNIWNVAVDGLPVDPASDTYVATIGAATNAHPDFGTVWEGAPIGIPWVSVPASQPAVPGTLLLA
jgi:hypothetical protein